MEKLMLKFAVLLSMVMLYACHNEDMNLKVKGHGEVRLSTMKLTYNTEPLVTESRASQDAADYMVAIYKDDNTFVKEWKYSEMPEVFPLEIGKYKIQAHSPIVEGAEFDAPYCSGESEVFEIKKDIIVDAGAVECTLKSIKVTIIFSDDLKPYLGDDVKVTVKVGEETLEFTKNETRSGFFHASEEEQTAVDVILTGTIDGDNTPLHKSYTVKEGTELKVTYNWESASSVDPGQGGSLPAFGITVKETVLELKSIEGSIIPEDEEIADFGLPSIEGVGFDIKETLPSDMSEVKINLRAPDGMAHVYVTINSSNTQFVDVVKDMFGGTNSFDLAYPASEEQKKILEGLGFPVGEKIIGQTGIVLFDITDFMGPLAIFPGTHTFDIEVVDKYEQKAKETLTIVK